MRVHAVSDVHGRADALSAAGTGADALICLGDLLLFIDYADHSQGIFPELFGAEQARRLIELRSDGRFDEARAMSRELWGQLGGDPSQHIEAAVARQYAELFAAMPVPLYLTYGNVDLPKFWADHARPGQHLTESGSSWMAGRSVSGGGLRTHTSRTRLTTTSSLPRSRPSERSTSCARTSAGRARFRSRHRGGRMERGARRCSRRPFGRGMCCLGRASALQTGCG
jgi:hypothetical protein